MFSTIDNVFKIIVIGDISVGKTSLITRLCQDKFDEFSNATIGVSFVRENITLDNNDIVTLDFWDTAGQERFRSIIPMYFSNTDGVILVCDVTQDNSFDEIQNYWLPIIFKHCKKLPVIHIAINKMDLINDSDIHNVQCKNLINTNKLQTHHNIDIPYFETSALTGQNIKELFTSLASNIYKKMPKHIDDVELKLGFKLQDKKYSSWNCCV